MLFTDEFDNCPFIQLLLERNYSHIKIRLKRLKGVSFITELVYCKF